MNFEDFKSYLSCLTSHVLFQFHGKPCGVDPISKERYDVWCGSDSRTMDNLEQVLTTPMFDHQPLQKVFNQIQDIEY